MIEEDTDDVDNQMLVYESLLRMRGNNMLGICDDRTDPALVKNGLETTSVCGSVAKGIYHGCSETSHCRDSSGSLSNVLRH